MTPVFNGATYIDDTIYSVLSQAGDFNLHYHVQDGGSTDDTMKRVRRWIQRAAQLPELCGKLTFTCASEPDGGMYDAINKGFARALPPGDDVVMGWIAADDRIAPGAFATIMNIRAEFPQVRFIGGRVALLDHTGSVTRVEPLMPFSQRCMAAGLYDGRTMPFIMQEGSFWCADVWRKIGGLDTRFRLAGDWDLWRRIAAYERYVCADSLLGFHRRRPGQLSEQMDRYYAEVDQALDAADAPPLPEILDGLDVADGTFGSVALLRAAREAAHAEHEMLKVDPEQFRASAHSGVIVRYHMPTRLWEWIDGFGAMASAPELVSVAGATESHTIRPISGFKTAEGPYVEFALPGGIRWMSGPTASGEVLVPEAGRYRLVVRCRSWIAGQVVTFLDNGRPIGTVAVTPYSHRRDIELSVEAVFSDGPHIITISVDQPVTDSYLLVIGWELRQLPPTAGRHVVPVAATPIPLASRISAPAGRDWPMISIVVPTFNQGQFIEDTLNSIIRQGYPNLELIVVDGGSTDATPLILRSFAPHITHLIAEPDRGQSDAINKGFRAATGEILSWLNSDDLLADGALHAVAHAFIHSGADMVAGVCDVFNEANRTTHRHMPCIVDGPLPLKDLLDIENHWIRGQFFHQPEVFFSRRIWERIGAAVDEDLFYSMDYDLWVRMARYNATIKVIGATVARYRMHPAQKTSTPEAYRPELIAHATKLRREVGLAPMPAQGDVTHRLRIVFFNDYGFKYGAGTAHRRLALALAAAGHDVVAVAYADFDREKPDIVLNADQAAAGILALRPDLVVIGNLHSIAADYDLLGALLPSGVPTIFYAHDQWIGTGRCAYPGDCTQYRARCTATCPTAGSYPKLDRDRVAPAYDRKRAMLAPKPGQHLAVLTNSRYMQDFLTDAIAEPGRPPIHVAPIGLDTDIFKMGSRWHARALLDLPQDRFIVITAAASLADERKGLRLLLDALERLDRPEEILLLIVGFGEPIVDTPFEVRRAGYVTSEELVALHYQAADILAGPSLAEAFGQVYIEAGACGIPSVALDVGGVCDAVLDGETGILVQEASATALGAAIVELRSDPGRRRRMGAQARLHAVNMFSLEASAAKLTAILVNEPALGLNLSPCVSLAADPPKTLTMQYLIKSQRGAPVTTPAGWLAIRNINEEHATADLAHLPERFWWASWPACRFLVRAAQYGAHTLQLKLRSDLQGQALSFLVNFGPAITVNLPPASFQSSRVIDVPVMLSKGDNLIDMRFAVGRDESPDNPRDLTMLVEEINIWPAMPDQRTGPRDGTCEVVAGFDPEEGPYPDIGLPDCFHWAVGDRATLQVFCGYTGPRVWEFTIRNPHPGQRMTIRIDDEPVGSWFMAEGSMSENMVIRCTSTQAIGFHTVTIETERQLESTTDPRRLAFIFVGLRLRPPGDDTVPIDDGIRWDLSSGVGAEEPPSRDQDIDRPFRWVLAPTAGIVVERNKTGQGRLRLEYRTPCTQQSALVRVNGRPSGRVMFDDAPFSQSGVVEHSLQLEQGHNFVELEFGERWTTPGGGRDLYLLIHDLSVEQDAGPVSDPSLSMIDVLAKAPPWEVGFGFSILEHPVPSLGIHRPFRWAIDGDSQIRLTQSTSRLKLQVRNSIADQELQIFTASGALVATAALHDDILMLQEVDVQLPDAETQTLSVRPKFVAPGSADDPRRLVYLLEDVVIDAA
ncbi:glycosyltransferase [Sphingomonas arantia]|uniref:Glycosyltransferase n=1 Tax=Sphingomonas arantia TaxID=1460676 RepID=A0ABW4U1V0_9SPHN